MCCLLFITVCQRCMHTIDRVAPPCLGRGTCSYLPPETAPAPKRCCKDTLPPCQHPGSPQLSSGPISAPPPLSPMIPHRIPLGPSLTPPSALAAISPRRFSPAAISPHRFPSAAFLPSHIPSAPSPRFPSAISPQPPLPASPSHLSSAPSLHFPSATFPWPPVPSAPSLLSHVPPSPRPRQPNPHRLPHTSSLRPPPLSAPRSDPSPHPHRPTALLLRCLPLSHAPSLRRSPHTRPPLSSPSALPRRPSAGGPAPPRPTPPSAIAPPRRTLPRCPVTAAPPQLGPPPRPPLRRPRSRGLADGGRGAAPLAERPRARPRR